MSSSLLDNMQYTRIAAVTGSNKGIGLACVRQLALQYPKSSYNNGPLLIYLTARNEERGRAALKAIHDDPQLRSVKALKSQGGLTDVQYLPLDVCQCGTNLHCPNWYTLRSIRNLVFRTSPIQSSHLIQMGLISWSTTPGLLWVASMLIWPRRPYIVTITEH